MPGVSEVCVLVMNSHDVFNFLLMLNVIKISGSIFYHSCKVANIFMACLLLFMLLSYKEALLLYLFLLYTLTHYQSFVGVYRLLTFTVICIHHILESIIRSILDTK